MQKIHHNQQHNPRDRGLQFSLYLVSSYEAYHRSLNVLSPQLDKLFPFKASDYMNLSWDHHHRYNQYKRIRWDVIYRLYDEGYRVRQVLWCSFSEFVNYMVRGVPRVYWNIARPPSKPYNFTFFYRLISRREKIGREFRLKQKFQKKKEIKKKVKTDKDKNRDIWWDKKGFIYEKKKHGHGRRGCPKPIKKYCNKKHRQWERGNINKGNWENLMDYRKIDLIQNPWI